MRKNISDRSTALSFIFNRLSAISGRHAVMAQPFILKHGISATEFFVDGRDHMVYFFDLNGHRFPLDAHTDFVVIRVATMLRDTPLKELRDNNKAVKEGALDAIDAAEFDLCEMLDEGIVSIYDILAQEEPEY